MTSQAIEVFDNRMLDLVDPTAQLEQLCTGAIWSEGPVYLPTEDAVLWSDIPSNRMHRWSQTDGMTTYRDPANFTNGATLDLSGRLVQCSHGERAVIRQNETGGSDILVSDWEGRRFNSPNDLVVHPDGSIWFTDPPYGIISNREGYQAESEIGAHHVFRFDPESGDLRVVVTDMDEPNGLAFSPDYSLLYIADTSADRNPNGNHHIRAYRIDGRRALDGRVFCVIEPGMADGFRLDINGNIFTSSTDSIQVYAPDGTRLGKIPIPERVGNCCWGGPGKNVLYVAASSSMYRITTTTVGHGLYW